MGFTFQTYPIVGGTVLIIERIQSQNYVPGVSGWAIDADGDAEFNTVVIRGDLITGPPGSRHIEIRDTPGNVIEFYTGEAAETAPGVLEVDFDGATEYFVRLTSPSTSAGASQLYLASDPVAGSTFARVSADITDIDSAIIGFIGNNLLIDSGRLRPTTPVWTNLALAGTWVTFGGQTPQYYVDAVGTVHLKGLVTGGGAGLVGTLPVGARPVAQLDYALKSNNDAGTVSWVRIATNGQITVVGNVAAAQVWLTLALDFSAQL